MEGCLTLVSGYDLDAIWLLVHALTSLAVSSSPESLQLCVSLSELQFPALSEPCEEALEASPSSLDPSLSDELPTEDLRVHINC
jgi:hypothetical protein